MAVIITPRYDLEVYNNVADEAQAPGLQQRQTFTKTVDGFLLTVYVDEARCMCPYRMTWNSIEFVKSLNHGDGIQEADNFLLGIGDASSQNRDSPTGGGSQRDGTNFRACNSHGRMRRTWADGFNHRKNPANWALPDQDISPPNHTRNPFRMSEVIRDTTMQIGASTEFPWATDHVITWKTTIIVPNIPRFTVTSKDLKLCPLTIYSDTAVFDQQEYIDLATGTATAYPGYPATSTTQVVATTHSDGTKGIAAYNAPSELGAGYFQGYTVTGIWDSFVICETAYPSGVPAASYTQHGAICWGTRADMIAALQLCYANMP